MRKSPTLVVPHCALRPSHYKTSFVFLSGWSARLDGQSGSDRDGRGQAAHQVAAAPEETGEGRGVELRPLPDLPRDRWRGVSEVDPPLLQEKLRDHAGRARCIAETDYGFPRARGHRNQDAIPWQPRHEGQSGPYRRNQLEWRSGAGPRRCVSDVWASVEIGRPILHALRSLTGDSGAM
jgi:hypothetical protein